MTFPETNRVIYEHNPLEEVLCQLRFPTILEIAAEKPAKFQNLVRDSYPIFEVEQSQLPDELAKIIKSLPLQPTLNDNTIYKFLSPDSKRLISLTPSFIAYSDKAYERWENFEGELTKAQQALETVYRPAFYTRLGLRYRNVIDRQRIGIPEVGWDQLLQPWLLGILAAPNLNTHIQEIESAVAITLVDIPNARATLRHGLGTNTLTKKEVYLIDIDYYTEERTSQNDVITVLNRFNRISGNFFRSIITNRLSEYLGPRDITPD